MLFFVDTVYDTKYNGGRRKAMSQWEKLLNKLKNLSPDMRFEELQKILESYGYEMQAPRGGSSHFSFRKKGKAIITIPKHKPIKKVYIKLVKNIVESEEEQ